MNKIKLNILYTYLTMSYWWILPFIVTELTSDNTYVKQKWIIEIMLYVLNSVMVSLLIIKLRKHIKSMIMMYSCMFYITSLILFILFEFVASNVFNAEIGAEHSLLTYYIVSVVVNVSISVMIALIVGVLNIVNRTKRHD